MASTFVESLRRLYLQGKIAKAKLDQLLADSKITQDEYNYIVGNITVEQLAELQSKPANSEQ